MEYVQDYPDSFKNLDHVVRKKAIDIANALAPRRLWTDGRASPVATQSGQRMESADASKDERKALSEYADRPSKARRPRHAGQRGTAGP
ncbi:MAG: hypothetical protein U5K84_11445 [Alkalibacterium sp.]|nr:hypothetical protein [Alkalibacterium sp.]